MLKTRTSSRTSLVALVIILLVALALRLVRLEQQPLWWDEGNSVYLGHQSVAGLLRQTIATHDTDPPAYRLALGIWTKVAGSSPFAVRCFSALLGLVAIALAWAVARRLAGERVAILAALLVAILPMPVYYAREAKGYLLALVCAELSVYAWGCRLGYLDLGPPSGRKQGWWAAYILSTATAIATHYYLAGLLLWQCLWVVGRAAVALLQGSRPPGELLRSAAHSLLSAAAITLILAPWMVAVFDSTVGGVAGLSAHGALPLGRYLGEVAGAWAAGPLWTGRAASLAIAVSVALAAIGAMRALRRAFLLSWIIIPLLASYLIQARFSFFHPRFLLYLAPAWYLLVSQGIVALGRTRALARLALGVGLTMLCLPGLMAIYAEPVDQAEDPRPWLAHLREEAQPGDALGYTYIWQVGYLYSYYPENTLSLRSLALAAEVRDAELESILDEHPRLWLLDYGIAPDDAQNVLATWLDAGAYKVDSWRFGEHYLTLYAGPGFTTPGVGPERGAVEFGGQLGLSYPRIDTRAAGGDLIALALEWRALTALDEYYQVFVHIGLPGSPPLAQQDSAPANGRRPTRSWQAGDVITDRHVLRLPQGAPPGRYAVMVGLYRPGDGSRLPVSGAQGEDFVLLGSVQVD